MGNGYSREGTGKEKNGGYGLESQERGFATLQRLVLGMENVSSTWEPQVLYGAHMSASVYHPCGTLKPGQSSRWPVPGRVPNPML